jgi:hypothetical protein
VSRRRATTDAALPEELRTDASIRNYPTPSPAAVRPPSHGRAVEVRGTTTAMWRLTRGSIGAAAGLLVAIALFVGALVSDVDTAARWFFAVVGALVVLLAGRALLPTIRAWRYVLTRPWQYFDGHTYVSKMAARVDLRAAAPDPDQNVDPDRDADVMYFAASANQRQREALRTGMFAHVWFVGDLDHAGRGVVAPAGGGPMIWVRRRAALLSPTMHGQVKLIRFGVSAARLSRLQERYDRQEHRRLTAIERLAARSGPAKTDRPGSARTARREREAKQRAAATASGQALPTQLQRRGRRQNVSGLLPTSGDESE